MASVCTKYIVHVFHGWLLDGIGIRLTLDVFSKGFNEKEYLN